MTARPMTPCVSTKCTPSQGLSAWNTRTSSMMWISPPMASTTNQTSVIGPKKLRDLFGPARLHRKQHDQDDDRDRQHRIRRAIPLGMRRLRRSFRPSTADSTEMAGVMTASP